MHLEINISRGDPEEGKGVLYNCEGGLVGGWRPVHKGPIHPQFMLAWAT